MNKINLDEELNIYEYKIKRYQDDLICRSSTYDNRKICEYMSDRFKKVYGVEI